MTPCFLCCLLAKRYGMRSAHALWEPPAVCSAFNFLPWVAARLPPGTKPIHSGKGKAHKHKQFFRWLPGWGGVSQPVGQWSNVYVLCAEPKDINISVRYPAGRTGDQGDRDIVYVSNVYVPFLARIHAGKYSWVSNFCAKTCGACILTRTNTGKYC